MLGAIGMALGLTSPATPVAAQGTGMPLPADIELRVGESATLDDGALEMSLVQLVEDSRCPMDAIHVST